MIIDSAQYNGACTCGREHVMQTEFCEISAGCLRNLNQYLTQYGIGGHTVAIYDENTYRATADRHPTVCEEVVLDPTDLHANEHGVDYLMSCLPKQATVLIAIGAGTVHDLTRYCAYTLGLPFVSCPTAASVDGFCSSVAAMTWHGCKKTLTAVAPRLVIADLDVIKNAPMRLTRSGFGDMIGKYVALTDWKLAHILTGEFYCPRIAALTLSATEAVLRSVDGILRGENEAYASLTYGLLLSGLAMQMMGNSRPASGAEHHISHLIEMSPCGLGLRSDALHGEKVGVGTLLALEEYRRLATLAKPAFADYRTWEPETVTAVFGTEAAGEILKENESDAAASVTAALLNTHWQEMVKELERLPDPTRLRETYAELAVKDTLADLGVDNALAPALLQYSPMVRNRLTLMRLRACLRD